MPDGRPTNPRQRGCAPPLDSCALSARGLRVFAAVPADAFASPTYTARRLVQHDPRKPTWHTVTLSAVEIERVSDVPVPQLSPSQIDSQGRQNSKLRARIAWAPGSGRSVDVDVGGGVSLSVYSCSSVVVDLLVPVGAIFGPTAEQLTGRVIDTSASGSILEADAPTGSSRARLTTVITAAGRVPVPAGARRATFTATGAVTLGWLMGADSTLGNVARIGRVVVPAADLVATCEVPGVASLLEVPALQGEAFTVVWELDL